MEEGHTLSSVDKDETTGSSGGSGDADSREKGDESSGRKSFTRDGSMAAGGLGGPAMGPPRRATMMTDGAEGRSLVR